MILSSKTTLQPMQPGIQATESHAVFTHKDFVKCFTVDLANARGLVLIQSPYLSTRRINDLRLSLEKCIYRGVRVCVFAEKPRDMNREESATRAAFQSSLDMLGGVGAHVTLVPRIHEKLAIIDETIFWDGSYNILSHLDTSERMTRWVSLEKVCGAIELHKLHDCVRCSANAYSRKHDRSLSEQIGARLTARRIMLGWSQVELSKRSGVRQATISEIESGKRDVQLSTLERLARALGMSCRLIPWYLLSAIEERVEP
jgi:DNA-binding XRE family transcriptional regulator